MSNGVGLRPDHDHLRQRHRATRCLRHHGACRGRALAVRDVRTHRVAARADRTGRYAAVGWTRDAYPHLPGNGKDAHVHRAPDGQ